MFTEKTIELDINGARREVTLPSNRTLLEALRELGHVEVKSGCEKGDCGACAVLIDGEAVDSCLTFAATVDGHAVTTVKGLRHGDEIHPLQSHFIEHGAVQCGYCTPGMIMASVEMLKNNPNPTEEEIRHGLEGNFCRCTGYHNIVKSVKAAAVSMKGGA